MGALGGDAGGTWRGPAGTRCLSPGACCTDARFLRQFRPPPPLADVTPATAECSRAAVAVQFEFAPRAAQPQGFRENNTASQPPAS